MSLKAGLLLSDSLFRKPPYEVQNLKRAFSLDRIHVAPYSGYTTAQLIGKNGVVHELMKAKTISHLFLCCGANDFNQSQATTGIRKGQHVINIVNGLLHSFLQQYPSVGVTLFPIPFRQVCDESRRNVRFPNNSNPDWIETTNAGIEVFQERFQVCECHRSRCNWVASPGLATWIPLLELDGLHLTQNGKIKVINQVCKLANASFTVPLAADTHFPPLKKPPGPFEPFKHQVELPEIKRIPRRVIKVSLKTSKPNSEAASLPHSPTPFLSPPSPSLSPPLSPPPSHSTPPSQKRREGKPKSQWLYT